MIVVQKESRIDEVGAQFLHHPHVLASKKMLERKRVLLNPGDLPIGNVGFIRAALNQLGKQLPVPNDYPTSLLPYLHRKVWKSTLGEALESIGSFVKPAERLKSFTGFVMDYDYSMHTQGASLRQPVWVSERVQFVSEHRYYVINRNIATCGVAVEGPIPDFLTVVKAVRDFKDGPANYAIDFGVLSTGETALIEVNAALGALGLYEGADPETYLEFLHAGWVEHGQKLRVGTSNPATNPSTLGEI